VSIEFKYFWRLYKEPSKYVSGLFVSKALLSVLRKYSTWKGLENSIPNNGLKLYADMYVGLCASLQRLGFSRGYQ